MADISSLYVNVGDTEIYYTVEEDTSMSGVGGWDRRGNPGYGKLEEAQAVFTKTKETTYNRVRIVQHTGKIVQIDDEKAC